jgi:flagellar biosynthesis protein
MTTSTDDDLPRKKAVALRYDAESEGAPKVVAKGAGYQAEHILQIAKENDIHIYEDPDMVNILATLDIQAEVPENLYKAIAEVLAFVYQLNKRVG